MVSSCFFVSTHGLHPPIPRTVATECRERGAVLIEFALILPVFVVLLLGTITGGLALATNNSMTNAVREASRLGATLPKPAAPEGWDDWADAVRERASDLAGGDLSEDQVCVDVRKKTASDSDLLGSSLPVGCASAAAPPVPDSTPIDACVVRVWAQRTANLNAFVFSQDLTLRAQTIARYERPDDCE